MVTAIILINVERHKVNEIAEQLAGMRAISEVYSVSGNYDLIAVERVASNDDLAELVTGHLLKIDGIERTETRFAFKAYSRHDLEAMFSVCVAPVAGPAPTRRAAWIGAARRGNCRQGARTIGHLPQCLT